MEASKPVFSQRSCSQTTCGVVSPLSIAAFSQSTKWDRLNVVLTIMPENSWAGTESRLSLFLSNRKSQCKFNWNQRKIRSTVSNGISGTGRVLFGWPTIARCNNNKKHLVGMNLLPIYTWGNRRAKHKSVVIVCFFRVFFCAQHWHQQTLAHETYEVRLDDSPCT